MSSYYSRAVSSLKKWLWWCHQGLAWRLQVHSRKSVSQTGGVEGLIKRCYWLHFGKYKIGCFWRLTHNGDLRYLSLCYFNFDRSSLICSVWVSQLYESAILNCWNIPLNERQINTTLYQNTSWIALNITDWYKTIYVRVNLTFNPLTNNVQTHRA